MGKRNSSSLTPSNSMLLPLQMPPSRHHQTGDEYSSFRQLALVTTSTTSAITPFGLATTVGPRFSLPAGWGVEEVPRSDCSKFDRYYYEPGTGQKFRSLREVERHLNGEKVTRRRRSRALTLCNRPKSSPSRKMIIYGGKMLRLDDEDLNANHWAIVPSRSAVTTHYQLPDGWVVEVVPRKTGNLRDKVWYFSYPCDDIGVRCQNNMLVGVAGRRPTKVGKFFWSAFMQYYYEPGTGRKFRSRVAVERHLTEMSEHMSLSEALEELNENRPLSKMFKLHQHTTNSASWKRKTSREVSFVRPPSKVNWVLASPKGGAWNPFIGDTLVSDSVKQQWSKRFMLFMTNEASAPISI